MFPMATSANTNQVPSAETVPIITKDNAQAIVEAAKQGDKNAIKTINNLDCFNTEKIQQKGTLKVSSKEGNKEYYFNDGSSITMSVGREISPENTISATNYTDWGMAQWKILGVEVARYYIYHEIELAAIVGMGGVLTIGMIVTQFPHILYNNMVLKCILEMSMMFAGKLEELENLQTYRQV